MRSMCSLPALVALLAFMVPSLASAQGDGALTWSPAVPAPGETVTFFVTVASPIPPDGLGVRLEFGDSEQIAGSVTPGTGPTISFTHVYAHAGTYVVEAFEIDPGGADLLLDRDDVHVRDEPFAAFIALDSCPADDGSDGSGAPSTTTVQLGTVAAFWVCTNTPEDRQYTLDFGDGSPLATVSVDSRGRNESVSHVYSELGTYTVVLTEIGPDARPGPADTLTVRVLMHPGFDPDGILIDLSVSTRSVTMVFEQAQHRPLLLTLRRSGPQPDEIPPLCYLVRLTPQNANVPGNIVGDGGPDAFFRSPADPQDPDAGSATFRVNFPAYSSADRQVHDLFIAADALTEPDEVFLVDVLRIGPVPVGVGDDSCVTLPDTAIVEPSLSQHRVLIRDPAYGVPLTLEFSPTPALERAGATPVQLTAVRELQDDVLPPDACYLVTLVSYTATVPPGGAEMSPDIAFTGPGSGADGTTFQLEFTAGDRVLHYPNRLYVLPDTEIEGTEAVHFHVRRCGQTSDDPTLTELVELQILDDDAPFGLTVEFLEPADGNLIQETDQNQQLLFRLTREVNIERDDVPFPQRCYRIVLDPDSAATVPPGAGRLHPIDRYPIDVAFWPPPSQPPLALTSDRQQAHGFPTLDVVFPPGADVLLVQGLFLFGDRRPENAEWARMFFYEGAEDCGTIVAPHHPTLTEILYIADDDQAQETVAPLVVAFARLIGGSIAGALADRADCSLTGRCAAGITPAGMIPPWLAGDVDDRHRAIGSLAASLAGVPVDGSATGQLHPGHLGVASSWSLPPGERPAGWVGDPSSPVGGASAYRPSARTLLSAVAGRLPRRWMVQPRHLPGGAPLSSPERAWTFWGNAERRRMSVVQERTALSVAPALTLLTAGADRRVGPVLLGGLYTLATGEGRAVLFNARHERVWKSHQYGPYVVVPLGTRVRIWGGGYLQRGRMDQRAFPDPFDVLGVPVDVRGTVALGGIKLVLFRSGPFDVGFTADMFQGVVSRVYPHVLGEDGGGLGDDADQTRQPTFGQIQQAERVQHGLEHPRHRPLENLPYGRQRLAAVIGYQVVRNQYSELRLALEVAGRRDVGLDRPSPNWPLPSDRGRAASLRAGDLALRLSWTDSQNHLALSAGYLVQVFHQSGFTTALRSFSAALRFGRVGAPTGPWLSIDPTLGVRGLHARSSWQDSPAALMHRPQGLALPVRAGYNFSADRGVEVSVTPPVREHDAIGLGSPPIPGWEQDRWSVAVTARLGL